ncbi:MAG: aconitate hydratase, partial [Actinomycetia bacterium]|nr:aconitate hydratase [Actinomycetes bacterium]
YQEEGVPLVVLGGKEYGTGSSRDWAAKGSLLLGIRAVITGSFERIHRSNLIGMGVLPLEFAGGESAASLGLTGRETYDIGELAELVTEFQPGRQLEVTVHREDGSTGSFRVDVRLDTPQEARYYHHGGILQYVLRKLM